MYFSKTLLLVALATALMRRDLSSSHAFTMSMMNGSGGSAYGQRPGSFFEDTKPGQVSERQVSKAMWGSESYNNNDYNNNNNSPQGGGNYEAPVQGAYSNGGGGGYGGNQYNPYGSGGGYSGGNQNNYRGGGGGFAENYQGGRRGSSANGQQFQQRAGGYSGGAGSRQYQERNSGMPFQGGGYGGQGNIGQQRMGGPRSNMDGPRMGGPRMGGPRMGGPNRMGGPGMGRGPRMGGPGMGMGGPDMGRRDMRSMGGPPRDEPFMRAGPGMRNVGGPREFDMRGPRDGGYEHEYGDPMFSGYGNMEQGRGHFADPGRYEGLTDFGGSYSYNRPNRVRRFGDNDQRTRSMVGDRDFYSPISRQTY